MFLHKGQIIICDFFKKELTQKRYSPPRQRGGCPKDGRGKPMSGYFPDVFFVIIFFFLFNLPSFPQSLPIQISTQLIPPYSGYLPDYADPFNEKLKFILQLNDFSVPDHTVKLKIKITGQNFIIQSKSFFNGGPVTLIPGIPYLLTGSELAPYLETQNLDFSGINPADYELRKVLPEGYYSICITAYDYYSTGETVLSNESCTSAWFMLSDPPFLNTPFCGSEISPITPQQIMFQWTPMNIFSPNSFANTEYDFELFEIRPDGNDPNIVVQTMAPVFTVTTTQPFFNYGMTETPLITGMQYVWRVRARDVSGRDLFKNNGYSQVCTFTYGNIFSQFDPDAFTLNLFVQVSTHRQAKLWWNNISNFYEYKLQVRKSGTQNWFDHITSSSQYKVNQLEPNTTYEARVKGFGSDIESGWSNTAGFTTNAETVINCNDQNIPANPLDAEPLTNAFPGNIFSVGQFEMTVTAITSLGQPGYFSGYGKIKIFGIWFAVECQNIFVNDNLVVQGGRITVVTQDIDTWISDWENSQEENTNEFDFNVDIDSIINDNGNIIIITENGDTISTGINPGNFPALITDQNGDHWVITENGIIIQITEEILNIIKDGVEKLELENSSDRIDELKEIYEQEKTNTENAVTASFENLELNETSANEEETGFSFVNEMVEDTTAISTPDDFTTVSTAYKTAQFRFEKAVAARSFARSKTTEDDFLFLAQWLKFNEINISEHIKNGLENNVSANQLSDDVKVAMEKLITKILEEIY